MRRLFIYDDGVIEIMQRQGVSDVERRAMELAIMRGEGARIPQTGGLLKIRCGASGRGKSGSVRIIYADYPVAGRAYLLAAFGKNEQANLTGAERNDLRMLKERLDQIMRGVK